jgi:hypothetical protein
MDVPAKILADALTCPSCDSHLVIEETHSGWRTVSVAWSGPPAGPASGQMRCELPHKNDVVCPACDFAIDTSAPYRPHRALRPRGPQRLPRLAQA